MWLKKQNSGVPAPVALAPSEALLQHQQAELDNQDDAKKNVQEHEGKCKLRWVLFFPQQQGPCAWRGS